jgi:predicted DNA-binding protein
MASTTVSIRLNDEEQEFFGSYAKLEKKGLSVLFKEALEEKVEDLYDSWAADRAHREYLKHPERAISHEELLRRYVGR